MITTKAVMDSLSEDAGAGPLAVLSRFRLDFHRCLRARGDELPELADAVLCADGPVRSLAGLPEVMRMRATYDTEQAAISRLRSAAQTASAQGSVALLRRCEHDLAGHGVRPPAPGVLPTT